VVVYVGSGWFLPDWQWEITEFGWSALFTPLLGLFMGLSMTMVGVGLVLYTKKLLRTRPRCRTSTTALTSTASHRRHPGQRLPRERSRPAEADHPLAGLMGGGLG
jgi:hypothetical protein